MTLSVKMINWCARHSVCSFQSFSRGSFIICVTAFYRHHCAPPFAFLRSQRLNVLKCRGRNFHAAMLHCTARAGLLAHRARLAVAHLDPRHASPRALLGDLVVFDASPRVLH